MSKAQFLQQGMQAMQPLSTEHMKHLILNGLEDTAEKQHVIIVGAGISGLVAGTMLKAAGHQVTILESSDIVGGRVRTLREEFSQKGLYAEAGAMRIPYKDKQGNVPHPLVNLYIDKVFHFETNTFIDACDRALVHVNGEKTTYGAYNQNPDLLKYPLNEYEKGKTADILWNEAVAGVLAEIELEKKQPGGENWPKTAAKYDKYSVRTFLRDCAKLKTPNGEQPLSEGAIEMIGVMLDEEEIMMTSFVESIRDQTDITPTMQYREIVGGNDALPKGFLPELEENILFNARMVRVEQDSDGVTIEYIDPRNREQTHRIRGDRAIFTIPFSALRFVEIEPLQSFSHEKRQAIRELHYDTSTKILLEFKSAFWTEAGIHGGGSISDLPIRFTYYPSHTFPNTEHSVVLASYTWGDDALRWDSLSEENRIYYALKFLSRLHGPAVYEQFVTGTSHSWLRDEHTNGAFALFEPEQQTLLYPHVATPEGRVYFAGEHTTLKHAWIEGAIESGIRAAAEVHAQVGAVKQASLQE